MGHYHNTAIIFGRVKDALLHFEHVIAMNVTGEAMGFRPSGNQSGQSIDKFKEATMRDYREFIDFFGTPDAMQRFYPPPLAQHPFFKGAVNIFDGLLFAHMIKALEGEEFFQRYLENLAQVVGAEQPVPSNQFNPSIGTLQRVFSKLATDFQLQGIPIDCSPFFLQSPDEHSVSGSVSVHGIRVIDTDNVPLPQIIQFRRDKETMKKMRAFRLFAYEQYSGKDQAYVEDDLQKRLSDYDDAVKSSGFETKIKTLSFLFESKVLLGALATSAVAVLIGDPSLAIEAFGAGTILEVGKLSLEYAKQRHELREICRENPISYIADAKRILKVQ